MEPTTLEFNFGTSIPKQPFVFSVQEAPRPYTIKKITIDCAKLSMLIGTLEIRSDKSVDSFSFVSGAEINRPVSVGQSVRVIITAKEFIPSLATGSGTMEIA